MLHSSVPRPQLVESGFNAPEEAVILEAVLDDFNAALGGNMNRALETPQGQLASSLTAIVADKNALFLALTNQFNPDTNEGRFQDAIARIYFIDRHPAVPTTVDVDCSGLPNVIIPQGALVKDGSGNLYQCTRTGKIPELGTIPLPFACLTVGTVPCPANFVTRIYQSIAGWTAVNNPQAGIVGRDVEARADFAYRRQNSVAMNAWGNLPSIYANVFNINGVIDLCCRENRRSVPFSIGGDFQR